MRISDWSSDVCSSDLEGAGGELEPAECGRVFCLMPKAQMGSRTVDKLQGRLREEVFHYAADSKKAAGRALGTIVELVTFYKPVDWGLTDNILIERRLHEYANLDRKSDVSGQSVSLRVDLAGRGI